MEIENPEMNSTKKSKRDEKNKKRSEFEFCDICKLNHDQGQRHKYFPSHKKSLSIVFSKFQTKLSDVRFLLKNPTLLRPELAARNRLWCVFCDRDIDELGSSFACHNAINHLSSVDHLKKLKHFLWKYGGGTDFVDKFRIKETEFAKWEKKCKSLKKEKPLSNSEPVVGPSNDIHNELNYVNNALVYSNNLVHSVTSSISNGVLPLQFNTNEYHQVSSSGLGEGSNNSGFYSQHVTSSIPLETYSGTSSINSNGPIGNVHTGALPPWLQSHEVGQLNLGTKTVSGGFNLEPNKPQKSKKLNPKRVGAAWAERRKMEMELEKRGEIAKSEFDPNWLPNFGRVWQSGTRKDSRKEFDSGQQSLTKDEIETPPPPPEPEPVKIQPYVSKRMLRDASK